MQEILQLFGSGRELSVQDEYEHRYFPVTFNIFFFHFRKPHQFYFIWEKKNAIINHSGTF